MRKRCKRITLGRLPYSEHVFKKLSTTHGDGSFENALQLQHCTRRNVLPQKTHKFNNQGRPGDCSSEE
jgi:hypothetical protein